MENNKIAINTSTWHNFPVSDIFDISIAKSIDKNKVKLKKDGINYISRRTDNNGFEFKVLEIQKLKNNGCAISLSMVGSYKGTAFWQKDDFLSSQNILLFRNEKLNNKNALFISTVLMKKYRVSNDYNALSKETILKDFIFLPSIILADGNVGPNWEFMENYITTFNSNSIVRKTNLLNNKLNNIQKISIDTSYWHEFLVSEVVSLKSAKNREASKYSPGHIRFVASGSTNNGVQRYVKPKDSDKLDIGNCLTFSTIDCSCFYQEIDYLGRGHGALIEIRYDKLNKYNAMFLATVLKQLSYRYNYNNQCWFYNLEKEKIKLPCIGINGVIQPDWDYMEMYIKELSVSFI